MIDLDDSARYLERAKMHEELAVATSDLPARKMHQAMAAEYRRKAGDTDGGMIEAALLADSGPRVLMAENHV